MNKKIIVTKQELESYIEYYNLAGKMLCYIMRPLLYIKLLPSQIRVFKLVHPKFTRYNIYQIVLIKLKIIIKEFSSANNTNNENKEISATKSVNF